MDSLENTLRTNWKRILIGGLLIAAVGIPISGQAAYASSLSQDVEPESAPLCPPCDAKFEWNDDQNLWVEEYNDPSITITGTERLVCWSSPKPIGNVCTKSGLDIYQFVPEGSEQTGGCLEATDHDLSNIVLCLATSTAAELCDLKAHGVTPVPSDSWYAAVGATSVIAFTLGAGYALERTKISKD